MLPTIFPTAIASDPRRKEPILTNSSGALVPSDTTVRPITSCGIPKIRDSEAEEARKLLTAALNEASEETSEPITNYTDDEQAQLAAEAEEARKLLTAALNEASEETSSTGCPSNTYIGQQQADGSWKTVCKK